MADFHVLSSSEDKKTVGVIFHFPVPAVNNQAGISYQNALVQFQGGASAIKSAVADATELASLQAGQLYEYQTDVRWSKLGLTPAQMLAEIKAAYNSAKAANQAELQDKLAFFGHSGSAA